MRLLIKFPTRERPEKFYKAIENITSNIHTDDYIILVSLDLDDNTMNTPGMKQYMSDNIRIFPVWGTSEGKIDAVNRDIWMIEKWDVIMVTSDDMWFTKKHFDKDILAPFREGFRGLLHFPDGHANEKLCTLPIMHREYYDKFEYIYYPGYWSVYADNEQHEVAVMNKKYRFINKQIFEHRHPIWAKKDGKWKAKADALLLRNENKEAYTKDGNLFKERKKINFGL